MHNIAVVATVVVLETSLPVSRAGDFRVGTIHGVFKETVIGVTPDSGVDVLAEADGNMQAFMQTSSAIPALAS